MFPRTSCESSLLEMKLPFYLLGHQCVPPLDKANLQTLLRIPFCPADHLQIPSVLCSELCQMEMVSVGGIQDLSTPVQKTVASLPNAGRMAVAAHSSP